MYTLFYGALVTPESLTEYTAAPQALVCVSKASGNIEWVELDVPSSKFEDTLARHALVDLQDHEIVELKHGEFIMPGFIDTHLVSSYDLGLLSERSSGRAVASLSGPECWKVRSFQTVRCESRTLTRGRSGQEHELLDWLKHYTLMAQGAQNVQQRVAVFAARQADHDPVAVFNHAVVADGLAHPPDNRGKQAGGVGGGGGGGKVGHGARGLWYALAGPPSVP